MALPQVSQLQSANKYKKYEAYFDSLGQATRLYMDNNAKDLFGNNTSGCVRVKYSELKAQGLVKDYGSADVDCGTEDTYVEVRKVNNIYKYAVSVVCKSQKNKNDIVWQQQDAMEGASCEFKPDTDAPIIEITPKSSDWKTSKQLTVHIKVSDVSGLNKNIRIQYYWLDQSGNKVGKTYKYNYNNKAGKEKVSYKIPVKNIPEKSGKYYLVVEPDTSSTSSGVMDALGNTKYTSEKAGIYKIDNTPPTCGSVSGAKTTWTNQNRTISVQCSDGASGCSKGSFSKTFTSEGKQDSIAISDSAGNSRSCTVNKYIDKTPPSISATWRREDNGATYSSGSLSDVSLIRKVNYSDNLSGVRTVEYNTGGGWATEGNLGDYKYASDTVNEYITFRAIDYAGNIGQTSQYHIRIEKDVDKDYHISCSITCHGACGLQKPGGGIYWNDSIYKWNLNGAKSGINRNTMGIDYSTDWVHNYCLYTPSNAPSGSRAGCGYAIFNSTTIDYSRSYACSSIIGRACTNKGKCAQCAITDRIGC